MSIKKAEIYAFSDEASQAIDRQIDALKRNGLMGSELRGTEFGNVSDLSEESAKEIKRRFDGAGLKIWSLGSPLGKIGIKDSFEPELDRLKRTLDIAGIFECENIRMFSFYIPRGEEPSEYKNAVLDRLSEMAETVLGRAVLCHENEKGIYGENDVRCREILDSVPGIAGVFDPANFVQSGVDTLGAWSLLKDRIKYMHIKDALSDGRVVPAGKGIGNLPQILKEFLESGRCEMTLEPHLRVFSGLKNLEREGERSQVGEVYSYPDSDTAFDAAANALKAVLDDIGGR